MRAVLNVSTASFNPKATYRPRISPIFSHEVCRVVRLKPEESFDRGRSSRTDDLLPKNNDLITDSMRLRSVSVMNKKQTLAM